MTTPSELPEPAQALLAQYPTSAPPWPVGAPVENAGDGLADRFRGALLWGAVGDASGRPTEARSWDAIRRRWGLQGVTAYHPWHGWQSGPIGTWTDDTQLTIEVAKTILESDGHVDPGRLSER